MRCLFVVSRDSAFRPRSLLMGKRIDNVFAKSCVMEALTEREKEVLLSEIQQIRAVLHPEHDAFDTNDLLSSDEEGENANNSNENQSDNNEDDDDYDDDNDDDDDLFVAKLKSSSAWQSSSISERSPCDDSGDESLSILRKAQNTIQKIGQCSEVPSEVTHESFAVTRLAPETEDTHTSSPKPEPVSTTHDHGTAGLGNSNGNENADIGCLEWALQLNRDYQDIVNDELIRIDCALRDNRSMQYEVGERRQTKKKENVKMLGYHFLARFKPTYFKDKFGEGPPDNEDSKERRANKINPFLKGPKLWKEKERKLLAEGVRNQNLEKMSVKLQLELTEVKRKAKETKDIRYRKEIQDLEAKMKNLKNLPKSELEENLEDIDFYSISRLYENISPRSLKYRPSLRGLCIKTEGFIFSCTTTKPLPKRTETECRTRWLNVEHPRINQNAWTKEEDTALVGLARKYNKRHWEKVAEELGTHRTPVQCCQRYQRSLNKELLKRGWTPAEDQELINAVNACPPGCWLEVAAIVGGRTSDQCLHRYVKTAKPGLKKGPWTAEENELLVKYTEIYGAGNWKKVSAHIPGRSDPACRERWVNYYDPKLKLRTKWSRKEDVKLLLAVKKYGLGKWAQVATEVPGRTDCVCWRRYKSMHKHNPEVKEHLAVVKKKRELMNYFIKRGRDRPNIDFDTVDIQLPEKKAPQPRKQRTTENPKRKKRKRKKLQEPKVSRDYRSGSESDASLGEAEDDNDSDINENDLDSGQGSAGEDFSAKVSANSDPDFQPLNFQATSNADDAVEIDTVDMDIVDLDTVDMDTDEEYEALDDDQCEQIVDAGERLVGRYEAGIASYVDIKRELYLLKLRIQDIDDKHNRERLYRLHRKQFIEFEDIRKRRTYKETYAPKKYRFLKFDPPLLDKRDTVHGPENIGIRSVRPVQIGHMPANLAPFTVLLEAFHIDFASIMNTLQNNGSGNSAPVANTSDNASNNAASTASLSTVNTRHNAAQEGKVASLSKRAPTKSFPQVIPIAPNVVTLKAFRKMLLHRRRLVELAGVSVKNEEAEPVSESDPQPGPSVAANKEECYPQPRSMYPADVAASHPKAAMPEDGTVHKTTRKEFQDSYDFNAISARFNALFLWPALLSAHSARIPYLRERQEADKPPRKRKKKLKKCDDMLNKLTDELHEVAKDGISSTSDEQEVSVTAKRDVLTKNAKPGMRKTAEQSKNGTTRGFNVSATADKPPSDKAALRAEMMWNGIVREENLQNRTELNNLDSREHTVSKRKGRPKKLPRVKMEEGAATNVKGSIPSNMKVKEEVLRSRRVLSRRKRQRVADISDESSSYDSDENDPDFKITKEGCYEPVAHLDFDTADPVLINKSSLRGSSKDII